MSRQSQVDSSDNIPYEKVGNSDPVSLADKIPFDIPESWEWARLGSVIELQSGQDLSPDMYNAAGRGIPYITGASNIENDEVLINRWTEAGRAFAYRGDLLLTCKGTVGTMAFLQEDQVHIARQIMAIRTHTGVFPQYIRLVLVTLVAQLKSAAKSMIPGISRDDVLKALIPVPPMEEQSRIVTRYHDIVPYLEAYDISETALCELNYGFPDRLKKSILQMAVQGKLVPQDPADESAEVLLARIREEKQRLVKEGKIKKDKQESIIFRRDNSHYEKRGSEEICIDEEIPFDIPMSWQWCRLHSILDKASTGPFGSILHKQDYTSQGIPLINPADIHDGKVVVGKIKFVSESTAERLSAYKLSEGDVIIGRRGEMGRSAAITKDTEDWLCGTGCFFVTPSIGFLPAYLVFLFNSPYIKTALVGKSIGTTMNNLNHEILGKLLVPLPPEREQTRIMHQYRKAVTQLNN